MARKMLITGGAGFIGANFVHYWLKHQPEDRIVVLDALTYAGNLASLEPAKGNQNYRFVHGDICDLKRVESLMDEETIDTIVHFAAESHVDRSISGPDPFIDTNIVGTHNLLKAAHKAWLNAPSPHVGEGRGGDPLVGEGLEKRPRFHHVSTDEVYGSLEADDPAFTETTPYSPRSPYAASKAASDHLVQAYGHTYGLPFTITNCSNNYGPYQFPEKLIPLMIVNALAGEPLPVYGDGLNVRDWLYVDDHSRGIELVLERGKEDETYNIGGNCEQTNIDLVKGLCDLLDEAFRSDKALSRRFPNSPAAQGASTHGLIHFVKDRPGHDRRYAMDITKMSTKLGYQPKEKFETGIRKAIQWYLDNEDWWRGIMDGSYRDWIEKQYVQR